MKTDEIKGETFSMKMHEFGSGARSTEVKPRYDLIPTEALAALARRFGYGAVKHGENNWRNGVNDQEFHRDRVNHAIEHIFNYVHGITTYDEERRPTTPAEHLEAAITNLAILCGLDGMKKGHRLQNELIRALAAGDADPLDIRKP